MITITQGSYGEIFQTIGLILDVVGVLLIVNFCKKKVYTEESSYGVATNLPKILIHLANEARFGSCLIVLGFIFQAIGVWF